MKQRISILAIPVLSFLLLVGSCASTPDVEPETTEEEQEGAEPVSRPDAAQKQAADLRSRIETLGLDELAPAEYKAAETKYAEGTAALDKDNAASQKAFEEAIEGYQKVLAKGLPLASGQMKARADSARKQADEVKGSVAAAEEYKKALDLYKQALDAEKAGNFENAISFFQQAEQSFLAVYSTAKEKRDRAAASLQESKDELEALETKMKDADDEIGSPGSDGQ